MNHMRVKPIALITLLTICHWAQAAELGNMEINSFIDQKLNADIPLNLAPNESSANTEVKIISSKMRNGNIDTSETPNIKINSDDGRLKLTSEQAIHTPQLELVLEVKTDHVTQYKQFSIDLTRASDNTPLIVVPKNKSDKSQATAQPIKKYYRKKNQTTALTTPIAPKTYPVKTVDLTEQKSIHTPSPINAATPEGSSPSDNTQTLTVQPSMDIADEQQSNPVTIATEPTLIAKTQTKPSLIQENAFTLLAFLIGILGALFLQKLLSHKHNTMTSSSQKMFAIQDQAQPLHLSLAPELESQTRHNERPNTNNEVALFEQLLRSRLQELKQSNVIDANQLTATINNGDQDLDDEDFGFDFDLPDFSKEQSKDI